MCRRLERKRGSNYSLASRVLGRTSRALVPRLDGPAWYYRRAQTPFHAVAWLSTVEGCAIPKERQGVGVGGERGQDHVSWASLFLHLASSSLQCRAMFFWQPCTYLVSRCGILAQWSSRVSRDRNLANGGGRPRRRRPAQFSVRWRSVGGTSYSPAALVSRKLSDDSSSCSGKKMGHDGERHTGEEDWGSNARRMAAHPNPTPDAWQRTLSRDSVGATKSGALDRSTLR